MPVLIAETMSSYEPLHHKYRPQTFAELVGQEAIATTLTNAIASQRIAPAYLFTGPRGTGKTSSARIFAKSLNCLAVDVPTASPCGTCEVCRAIARGSALDVIEIDAASNTGVDNIREIIERAQFAPVQCRYKVYVIDECHMLSVAAFNALLKTLEEPPERVIFVLATTDPQRVLPTIISRCQRFDYRRIPLEAMVKHLTEIAQKEAIEIETEALTIVAQIANGGLRDAESLLDQLSLFPGSITSEKVWDLVGAVPERDLLLLLQAIRSNNPEIVIESCRQLMDRGREPLVVLQNLANFYLNLLIAKTAPKRSDLVAVTATTWQDLCTEEKQWKTETILRGQQKLKESEVQLKNTTQPRLWLEITLLGLLPDACTSQVIIESPNVPIKTNINSELKPTNLPPQTPISTPPQSLPEPQPEISNDPVNNTVDNSQVNSIENNNLNLEKMWLLVLDKLSPFLSGLIKTHGHLINYQKNVATVAMTSLPLLNLAKGKLPQIESAFQEVVGHKVKVNLQVGSGLKPAQNSHKSSVKPSSLTPQNNALKPPEKSQYSENNNHKNLNNGHRHNSEITKKTEDTNNSYEPEEASSNTEGNKLQENIYFTEVSEDNIKKAAEQLAKFFNGEIINDYEDLETEENNIVTQDSQLIDNENQPSSDNQKPSNKVEKEQEIDYDKNDTESENENPQSDGNDIIEVQKSPKIMGRPENPENEEDLDF
jgi:DNA polymerase-3 subunit gamma/tau